MKIALICRRYYPEIGGVETHVREIAERLARRHQVTVYTLVWDKKLAGSEIINGVNIRRFKSYGLNFSAEIPPASLLRAVEEFNPDIVHSHSVHTSLPHFASSIKCKSKFVVTPHYQGKATNTLRRMLFSLSKPFLRSALLRADRIICVSSIEQDMLSRVFKVDQHKIRVVPNGVGTDLIGIDPESKQRSTLRILSVARFDLAHKQTDKLIQAFNILQQRLNATLVLIGDGPDKQEIISLVRELRLDEKVEIKSNLARKDVINEYAQASIFVTASEKEAYGIAVAEAIAAKLKVVVPNSTALASFVKNGYATGVELPVTAEKLAEAIIHCIQDNRRPAKQYSPYTWDMVAEELEDIYRNLLIEGRPLNQPRSQQKWSRI